MTCDGVLFMERGSDIIFILGAKVLFMIRIISQEHLFEGYE